MVTVVLPLPVRPSPPVISLSGSAIEGVSLTLICLSTGGYPQQTLDWYLVRYGQAPTLLGHCNTTSMHDDVNDLYNVTSSCTFTPTDGDNGATFLCQSSYSGDPQLEESMEVQLLIASK